MYFRIVHPRVGGRSDVSFWIGPQEQGLGSYGPTWATFLKGFLTVTGAITCWHCKGRALCQHPALQCCRGHQKPPLCLPCAGYPAVWIILFLHVFEGRYRSQGCLLPFGVDRVDSCVIRSSPSEHKPPILHARRSAKGSPSDQDPCPGTPLP